MWFASIVLVNSVRTSKVLVVATSVRITLPISPVRQLPTKERQNTVENLRHFSQDGQDRFPYDVEALHTETSMKEVGARQDLNCMVSFVRNVSTRTTHARKSCNLITSCATGTNWSDVSLPLAKKIRVAPISWRSARTKTSESFHGRRSTGEYAVSRACFKGSRSVRVARTGIYYGDTVVAHDGSRRPLNAPHIAERHVCCRHEMPYLVREDSSHHHAQQVCFTVRAVTRRPHGFLLLSYRIELYYSRYE